MNILFYSNNCPFSKEILNLIIKNQITNHFKLICIEDKNIKIPPFITNVPTLVVKNVNKPLIGLDAFNWIKLQKFINICTFNSTVKVDNPVLPNKDESLHSTEGVYTYIEEKDDPNNSENVNDVQLLINDKSDINDNKLTTLEMNDKIVRRNIDMEILFHNAQLASSKFRK